MSQAQDEAAANKEMVLGFLKLAQAGDPLMGQYLTEDYVQIFPRPGVPGMPEGAFSRAEVLGFLEHLSVYERGSMRMEVENILAEGPLVAVQFKMNATTARGEAYENFYCQFFICRDGLIAKAWEYCDTLYAARKLLPEALTAAAP